MAQVDLYGNALNLPTGTTKKKKEEETYSYGDFLDKLANMISQQPSSQDQQSSASVDYAPSARPNYNSAWMPVVNKAAADYMQNATYTPTWQEKVNEIADAINNRQPFKYDVNADELFNQYREQFIKNGRLAMEDTIGKAQQMSGGFGNSYAQTAGQQVYNQYMGELNDVIPELYSLAEARYNREGDQMRQNLAMYQGLEDAARSNYRADMQDAYNKLAAAMSLENNEYSRYRDNVADWQYDENIRYQSAKDKSSAAAANQEELYKAVQDASNKSAAVVNDAYDAIGGYFEKWKSGKMDEESAKAAAEAYIERIVNAGVDTETAMLLLAYFDKLFPTKNTNTTVDTSNPNVGMGVPREYTGAYARWLSMQ